jgi:hypothetical protein
MIHEEGNALAVAKRLLSSSHPTSYGFERLWEMQRLGRSVEFVANLDLGTATSTAYLISALSHACHYHPYELAPTAAELTGWLDQAAQVVTQIQAASAASDQKG